MQREWPVPPPPPPPPPPSNKIAPGTAEAIKKLMDENPVVIVGRQGCFMIKVIKHLLTAQGVVDPVVSEIGPDVATDDDRALVEELGGEVVSTAEQVLPVLVVGGQVVGGVDKVIAVHLSGLLALKLKQASAYLALNLY